MFLHRILSAGAGHALLARVKEMTGIVGLNIMPNAREVLISLYTNTLKEIQAVLEGDSYQKTVESFTRHRLQVYKEEGDWEMIEKRIACGQVEELIEELDQGLGIGSNFMFFNRHQLTLTRFIQLKPIEEGAGKPPPPIVVLHGHYGGCVGDLPSYDAFTLGGPYSVRGYNMGELGACRNILELAAELCVLVRNTHVYVFAEHENDLGSSKDVKENPTEFF